MQKEMRVLFGIFLLVMMAVFLVANTAYVYADSDDDNSGRGNSDDREDEREVEQGEIDYDDDSIEEGGIRSGSVDGVEARYIERERYRFENEDGEEFEYRYEYRERSDGSVEKRLRVERVDGDDDLEIEVEEELEVEREVDDNGKVKLKVKFSNGLGTDVKIMPDVAAERALERLRLHVCSEDNNCSIVLKDVGQERNEEQNRVAYEVRVEKKVRYFGIFPGVREVEAEIDSETGDVNVDKPWFVSFVDETVA